MVRSSMRNGLPRLGKPPRRLMNLSVAQWERVSRAEASSCEFTPAVRRPISGLASCPRYYRGAPSEPLRGT